MNQKEQLQTNIGLAKKFFFFDFSQWMGILSDTLVLEYQTIARLKGDIFA